LRFNQAAVVVVFQGDPDGSNSCPILGLTASRNFLVGLCIVEVDESNDRM